MSITRTAWTDDSGAGTDGTVINNAEKTAIYDQIDGRWSEFSTTSTGNQDNFPYSEADVLRCNNATSITLRGVLAPASPVKPGKRLIVVSVGAGTVVLNDQDTNSTAANRIITGTAAPVTLAAGTGWAWLEYDSITGRWRVVGSSVVSVTPIVQTTTSTGTVNDFALTAGVSLLRVNNATLLTLTGLSAGVDGQRVDLVSIGAGQVDINNQNAGSTAANRVINSVTGTISLAAGVGRATIEYDLTTARWRVLQHEQGAWITPTFAAGDFTAATGTWTVSSGNVQRHAFILRGRTVTEYLEVAGTSVSATPTFLKSLIPNSMIAAGRATCQSMYLDNGGTYAMGASWIAAVANTVINHYKSAFGNAWSVAASTTELYVTMTYEVQ